MIEDALEFDADRTMVADVCVVGAGAAGITLALELADRGGPVGFLDTVGNRADVYPRAEITAADKPSAANGLFRVARNTP